MNYTLELNNEKDHEEVIFVKEEDLEKINITFYGDITVVTIPDNVKCFITKYYKNSSNFGSIYFYMYSHGTEIKYLNYSGAANVEEFNIADSKLIDLVVNHIPNDYNYRIRNKEKSGLIN